MHTPMVEERLIKNQTLPQLIDKMYSQAIDKHAVVVMLSLLKKNRKVTTKEVADLILFMSETAHREWDIEAILNGINEVFDSINWRGVYEKFLEEDIKVNDKENLYLLVDCWVHISGIITVPYEVFFRPWKSRANQIRFLKILIESDVKRTQVYSNIFFEKLATKEELRLCSYKKGIKYESNLNSVEIFKCIKNINASEIIRLISSSSPEYCALGLAVVYPFCVDVFDSLVLVFATAPINHYAFSLLLSKYKKQMLSCFERICNEISLTTVLDILLEHKMLPTVSELLEPKSICFDLIILSSRRDHLNLDIWLANNFNSCAPEFISHVYAKALKKEKNHVSLQTDAEMFPLNKSVINNILRAAASLDVTEETQQRIQELRLHVSNNKLFDSTQPYDQATGFLSEIINSHLEVDASVVKLLNLINSDEPQHPLIRRIFSLLIDNYSNLFKLPNCDLLAMFFGELIRQNIFTKPFMKVALDLIKASLEAPESEREFSFAFRTLEMFFVQRPRFFAEIEALPMVVNRLVRKELLIIDEDRQAHVTFDGLLQSIFGGENVKYFTECKIKEYIINTEAYCKMDGAQQGSRQGSLEGHLESLNVRGTGSAPADSEKTIISKEAMKMRSIHPKNEFTFAALGCFIFKNLNKTSVGLFSSFAALYGENFREYAAQMGFEIVQKSFSYKFNNETEYYKILGTFLGLIVVARNRTVNLDVFDFSNFISKCIEYRRISICVFFIVNFLKEGKKGSIFVPNNPWLISIMQDLAQLYPCSLLPVREAIDELYTVMNIPLVCTSPPKIKEHLTKYCISYEGTMKQIISLAIDFSIREICQKIVASALSVAKSSTTGIFLHIFNSAKIDDADFDENKLEFIMSGSLGLKSGEMSQGMHIYSPKTFFYFRNLLTNFTRSLIHASSREPLKASISGNITHFLKLSILEMPYKNVYAIAQDNLEICTQIIEKVGITQANEGAAAAYKEMIQLYFSAHVIDAGYIEENLLLERLSKVHILNDLNFVEKFHVRSVENSEYQEIRS
ncbi:hypothetical protein ENBRE01_0174, partial [Enteropsectra breve]